MLNHGAEDRAKDLFFLTYETKAGSGIGLGVKIKVLSSVSILDSTGSDYELRPATKVLYSIINCQDTGTISLMSQMSVTKIVTQNELKVSNFY